MCADNTATGREGERGRDIAGAGAATELKAERGTRHVEGGHALAKVFNGENCHFMVYRVGQLFNQSSSSTSSTCSSAHRVPFILPRSHKQQVWHVQRAPSLLFIMQQLTEEAYLRTTEVVAAAIVQVSNCCCCRRCSLSNCCCCCYCCSESLAWAIAASG